MVDAFLIVTACIALILVIISNVVFIIKMTHPEDKNRAIIPKIIVLLGLTVAEVLVLMLPFDVAMASILPKLGEVDVDHLQEEQVSSTMWLIAYITAAGMAFVVIPFCINFYDTDEEDSFGRRLFVSIAWSLLILGIFAFFVGMLWGFLGYVELPVRSITSPLLQYGQLSNIEKTLGDGYALNQPNNGKGFYTSEGTVTIHTTVAVYILAMTAFVGWFLVMIFSGIGLVALPMDLINAFRTRPVAIDVRDFANRKLELKNRAKDLMDVGADWERDAKGGGKKARAKERIFTNKFKAMVLELENDYEKLMIEYKERGGNPLIPWFQLFLGIMSLALSFSWIIQVVVFIFLKPPHQRPFLNEIFTKLNDVFSLFGTVAYAVFAFYMLWAAIKGQMKFGLRFLIISIHPLQLGKTMMNSLMFNCAVILLVAAAVVQFCAVAFGGYAHTTAISQVFNSQVRYLKFLSFFYNYAGGIFYYIFFAVAGISFIFLIILPCFQKPKSAKEQLNAHR